MALHRFPVEISRPDANCFPALVSSQITAATTPSVGDLVAYVLDSGTDRGLFCRVSIPKNFVGSTTAPKIIVRGILAGAVSATHTLGLAVRKRANANNESADGTFDAEQTSSVTIGSTAGSSHSNEDVWEGSVTLTGSDYAVDDEVFLYIYRDQSGTTYTGKLLVTAIELEVADV